MKEVKELSKVFTAKPKVATYQCIEYVGSENMGEVIKLMGGAVSVDTDLSLKAGSKKVKIGNIVLVENGKVQRVVDNKESFLGLYNILDPSTKVSMTEESTVPQEPTLKKGKNNEK